MQSNQSTENCVSLLLMPSNSMHVLAFSLVMYVKYTVNICTITIIIVILHSLCLS